MRNPARLERKGAMTPRDQIWASIRLFGTADEFSVAEIMLRSGQRADTVMSYIGGLRIAGYVVTGCGRGPMAKQREFNRFKLVRDVGVEAPRVTADGKPVTQGIGREQMWTWMRKSKAPFTSEELAHSASTPAYQVSVMDAQHYTKFLTRAGYLHPERATGGHVANSYRFIRSRDTGSRAPLITRDKNVIDGNTGEEFNLKGGAT